MRLIAAYAGLPIVSIAIFFACVGAWAEFLMVDMLNALFRSAVGKRRGQYLSSCTRLQCVFRTYIPKITAYRRRLSRYLVFNRLAARIGAAGMLLLLGIVLVHFGKQQLDVFRTGFARVLHRACVQLLKRHDKRKCTSALFTIVHFVATFCAVVVQPIVLVHRFQSAANVKQIVGYFN